MVSVTLQKKIVNSAGHNFPIFIGFLKTADLQLIAEAPSFKRNSSHSDIARNISTSPIKDWQRPISDSKVNEIATTFDNLTGNFMPNPVLLSENVTENAGYTIAPHLVNGNVTEFWDMDISDQLSYKPMWILDGQHRIMGMAKSAQRDNYIPVVFLLNQGTNTYSGSTLAKLFAQVTTEATALDNLHNEWLTYAFSLKRYSHSSERSNAMKTVISLCSTPNIPPGINAPTGRVNPFADKIKFNPVRDIQPPNPGGFLYNCVEFSEIIYNNYYSKIMTTARYLPPNDLMEQIVLAHYALSRKVSNHATSVFFSQSSDYEQKIMQLAWLKGIFALLLAHPPMTESGWEDLHVLLHFDTTNWNFRTWCLPNGLSGRHNSYSLAIATKVMETMFVNKRPISTNPDIASYLSGDGAKITWHFSNLTQTGRASSTNRLIQSHPVAGRLPLGINPRSHIKIVGLTENIATLVINDDSTTPQGDLVNFYQKFKSGHTIEQAFPRNPWLIKIIAQHYGGNVSEIKHMITWS